MSGPIEGFLPPVAPQKKKVPGWVWALGVVVLCLPCTAIVGAVVFPVLSQARQAARETQALEDTRMQGLGIIMYASDNNDSFPLAGSWEPSTLQYLNGKTLSSYAVLGPRGPAARITFNSLLSGLSKNKIEDPSIQVMLFLSAIQEPSASAEPDYMVFTPQGRTILCLVDGAAKRATQEEVAGFRLDPEERL